MLYATFMKRHFLILLTFLLTDILVVGQVFSGNSDKKYQILFNINKDSSINFIYSLDKQIYAENIGTIKKINDSIFHISAIMTIGNDFVLSLYTTTIDSPIIVNDTDYFSIDSPFVNPDDTVIIKYSNGQTRNYFPYNKQGKRISFIHDKKNFNDKSDNNFFTVTIKRKNKITGQPLSFRIGQHDSFRTMTGEKIEFDIMIKNNKLKTINDYQLATGHFSLKKKSGI
jgi:hypothetical protein